MLKVVRHETDLNCQTPFATFWNKYSFLLILKYKEKSAESVKSLENEKEQLSLNLTSTKTLLEEKVCTTISHNNYKMQKSPPLTIWPQRVTSI